MDVRPCLDRPARELCLLLASRIVAASGPAVPVPHRRAVPLGSSGALSSAAPSTDSVDKRSQIDPRNTPVVHAVGQNHNSSNDVHAIATDTDRPDGSYRRDINGEVQRAPDSDYIQECGSTAVASDGKLSCGVESSIDGQNSVPQSTTEEERIDDILGKCSDDARRSLSWWETEIDHVVATLPARGPQLSRETDAPDDEPIAYSTATAAAALVRLLPTLVAHGLEVYHITIRPDHFDDVSSPWDGMNPIAEAYCGLGDWVVHVECGRKWYDDVNDGQELAGGVIAIRHIIHRQTRACVPVCGAPLGDGYDITTHDYFAFMRSGYTNPKDFVDAIYGPLRRAPRALATSFGWRPVAGQKDSLTPFDSRQWSIDMMRRGRSLLFERIADGAIVCLGTRHGLVLVGASTTDACGSAPENVLTDAVRDAVDALWTVARPLADYTSADPEYRRLRKAALGRVHADRAYLIKRGLVNAAHLALAPRLGRRPKWPRVHVPFASHAHTRTLAEEQGWHRCLAAHMDLVADLAGGGFMHHFDIDDDARAAISHASPQLQSIARPVMMATTRLDGRTLDAFADGMLSPVVLRPWRIYRPDRYLWRGSRYIDPTRGLYVNWRLRCNFVSSDSADGLAHARFYGHIVAVTSVEREDDDAPLRGARDQTAPTLVVGYYALSVRVPRSMKTYERWDTVAKRADAFNDMDAGEQAIVDDAIASVRAEPATRFGSDEPHHVIAHYRNHEFSPVPCERFRGILDEDAVQVDGGSHPAASVIRVFDWLREAFDRHASVFAVAH